MPVSPCSMEEAVRALHAGELLILPTETVYGIACDASSPIAVQRLLEAKGRDPESPFPLLVPDLSQAEKLLGPLPPKARKLAERFWPGPLTLVLPAGPLFPKASLFPGQTTGGVRVPDHPVAQRLLRAFGKPLAAPSANRSGELSPTKVEEAAAAFEGKVAYILDGGPARLGFDSTVLAFRNDEAIVLRLGAVALEEIQEILGPVLVQEPTRKSRERRGLHKPLRLFRDPEELPATGLGRAALMAWGEVPRSLEQSFLRSCNLSPSGDPKEAMQKFYPCLRALDTDKEVSEIYALLWPNRGLGQALNAKLEELAHTYR